MAAIDVISHRKSRERACMVVLANRQAPVVEAAGIPKSRTLLGFYVHGLRTVFREPGRPFGVAIFLVASALHSFGHAALALAAARCAVILAGSMGLPTGARQAGQELSSHGIRTALLFGSVGLVAALAKAIGGVVAAHGQATLANRVGGTLRLEVLDAWFADYRLRRPRQADHGRGPSTLPTTNSNAADAGTIPLRTAARGVSALTARVTDVETGLAQGLLGGGRALAQLLPILVALIWISPKLALVAFVVLAPFAWILSSSRRAWRHANRAAARDSEELLEAVDEAVRHADLWVSYSAETKARTAVSKLGESLGRRAAKIHATSAAMSGGNEVLAAVALCAALGAAQAGWLGDVGGGGRLLAFTVCFFLAYRPIRDLTESRLAWSRAVLAFGDLSETGGTDAETSLGYRAGHSRDDATPWPLVDLHVDGLVLRHGMDVPITFVVPAGELVVVVGATGEGKTTLLRTLLGLEPQVAGELRYGDARLTAVPPGLVHRPFAWVPQDSGLLADTLEVNVRLGSSVADVDAIDVRGTLRGLGAGADALAVATLGRRLGPSGVVVSGGERQWVALARALATSQPVLLLDEPTSGLDAESQAVVLAAIAKLRGKRSVVFVTHRPEPLALASIIVRFEDDTVRVEDGPARRRQPGASVADT